MRTLNQLLGREPEYEKIVAGFETTATALESLVARKQARATAISQEMVVKHFEQTIARSEADRASKTAAKLRELFA